MLKLVGTSNDSLDGLPGERDDHRTESDLVEAAREGDHLAFAELLRRHQKLVYTLATGITGSPIDGDEAAQEAFVVAWQKLPHLEDVTSFRAWLVGITRLVSRRLGYTRRRRKGFERAIRAEKGAPWPSPLDEAIAREEEAVVWRAVGKLPESYRVPIVLFYAEQRSLRKVAEMLDLTEASVAMRLNRGRKMLRSDLLDTIESALCELRPPKHFTAAVLVAVSAGPSTKAAARPAPGSATANTMKILLAASLVTAAGAAGMALMRGARTAASGNGKVSQKLASSLDFARRGVVPPRLSSSSVVGAPPAGEPATLAQGLAPLFSFDFEDGVLPPLLRLGHVVATAPGGTSRYCAAGTVPIEWPIQFSVRIEPEDESSALFSYAEGSALSFDYWVGSDAVTTLADRFFGTNKPPNPKPNHVDVEIRNLDQARNYQFYIYEYTPETWQHADLPLSAFRTGKGAAARLQDGDRIRRLGIFGGVPGGKPFLVDNLKLVSAPSRVPEETRF